MGVLEDIHKALGGSTAAGKKMTMTNAEKLELEETEKLCRTPDPVMEGMRG